MSEQDELIESQLKIMRRKILDNEDDKTLDDKFKDRLEDAKLVFLDRVYPYDKDIYEVPKRYTNWQTRCAIELHYLDEDGDFLSYSENALAWTKANTGLSSKLLNELPPPKAGVPS